MTTGGAPCAAFDSLYAHSGFEKAVTLKGKAVVDADQFRVRGFVKLQVEPTGDVVCEFASSVFFGGHVEDFVLSIVADTMRIVDRERGQYFEGDRAEDFLGESLRMGFGVRRTLGLALGGRPGCEEVDGLQIVTGRRGEVRVRGRVDGRGFELEFSANRRRLIRAVWPVAGGPLGDRLTLKYDWDESAGGSLQLREVVMQLEEREWRCKLIAASN